MRFFIALLLCIGVLEAAVFKSKLRHIKRPRNLYPKRPQFLTQGTIYEFNVGDYVIDVAIGTPPQDFILDLALEYTTTFVVGSTCNDTACIGDSSEYTKERYNASASSTYVDLGTNDTYETIFGNFSVNMASETFEFEGPISKDVHFGIAQHITGSFETLQMDGVIGLGLPASPIASATNLESKMFTIFIADNEYADGTITYGDMDMDNCEPRVTWLPTIMNVDWIIPIYGVSMGNMLVNREMSAVFVVDDLFFGGPSDIIFRIAQIAGAEYNPNTGLYHIPCSFESTTPDIIFNIAGREFNIPSYEYILDFGEGEDSCIFALAATDEAGADWYLGSRFMRRFCVTFDVENKKVGIAAVND